MLTVYMTSQLSHPTRPTFAADNPRAEEPPLEHPDAGPTYEDAPRRSRRSVFLVLAGASVLVGLTVWYLVIPYPWTLRGRNPVGTSLIAQRVAEARAADTELQIQQEWVTLAEISPALLRAVVVAEDYRFREHDGIDWVSLGEEVHWTGDAEFSWWSASDLRALCSALGYAWTNRADLRGRSTITQQLAKNLYFGTDRSLLRKAKELVVARRLERRLGKDRILELYLNVAEWGPGVFGVEAASRTYFGRSASTLTLTEAAALAGTLPHPLTSNPAHNPGRMRWRQSLILDRLDPARGLPPPPGPLPELEIDLVETEIPVFDPLSPSLATPESQPVIPSLPTPESLVVVPDTL